MTFEISFHSLAERELNEAASFYEDRSRGLGKSFLNEIEHTLDLIHEHPQAAALVTETVRRQVVRRFPYAVLYSVRDDRIRVLAIMHEMRRPLYWIERS